MLKQYNYLSCPTNYPPEFHSDSPSGRPTLSPSRQPMAISKINTYHIAHNIKLQRKLPPIQQISLHFKLNNIPHNLSYLPIIPQPIQHLVNVRAKLCSFFASAIDLATKKKTLKTTTLWILTLNWSS